MHLIVAEKLPGRVEEAGRHAFEALAGRELHDPGRRGVLACPLKPAAFAVEPPCHFVTELKEPLARRVLLQQTAVSPRPIAKALVVGRAERSRLPFRSLGGPPLEAIVGEAEHRTRRGVHRSPRSMGWGSKSASKGSGSKAGMGTSLDLASS